VGAVTVGGVAEGALRHEAKRYCVTVEREVIVYASSPEEAEGRALAYLAATSTEPPAGRPVKVVDVAEVGAADEDAVLVKDR
jgi:hypothetical protein